MLKDSPTLTFFVASTNPSLKNEINLSALDKLSAFPEMILCPFVVGVDLFAKKLSANTVVKRFFITFDLSMLFGTSWMNSPRAFGDTTVRKRAGPY